MRIIGILLLCVIIAVVCAVQYFFAGRENATSPELQDALLSIVSQDRADLEKAKITLEKKKIEEQIKEVETRLNTIERNNAAKFYGVILFLAGIMTAILIVAAGFHRSKVRAASVHIAKIGKSEIPVHVSQIEQGELAEQLTILANAEALKQHNKGIEQAYQLHVALSQLELQRLKVLQSRSMAAAALPEVISQALPLPSFTMRELLDRGELAPGKPIHFGHVPAPAEQVISLGLQGWQGSGKTNVMAFLTVSLIMSADADVYVIDPHQSHEKSLSTLLKPLETSGRVHFVQAADVTPMINQLDRLLDDRLAGRVPCVPAVGLVIDELVRLSKIPAFDTLIEFLKRCVTEVRKANMFFIGGSHSWKARNFKNDSDIRAGLNATLILPTKPSHAELLLEDSQEKKLVKSLDEPGKGLLSLSTGAPQLVKMPFCTQADFEELARRLVRRDPVIDIEAKTVLTKEELARGRRRLNLSQAEFAAKVGLSQKQISRLEKGESNIIDLDSDALDQILDVLDGLDGLKSNVVNFPSKACATGV